LWYSFIFAILVLLPMLPLWPGLDKWAVLQASHGAGRSLLATGVLALEGWLGTNTAFQVMRWLLYGLWLTATGWTVWQYRRKLHHPETLFAIGWAVFFWYVLLVAPVFHGWYLLWALALAVLLGRDSRVFRATLAFTFTAVLVIPYFETVRAWYPVLLQNPLLGHLIGVGVLVVPPLWVLLGKDFNFPKVVK